MLGFKGAAIPKIQSLKLIMMASIVRELKVYSSHSNLITFLTAGKFIK